MWVKQLRYFGRLGYNCIAFDMRGYFASEKPAGFAPYAIAEARTRCTHSACFDWNTCWFGVHSVSVVEFVS